mmetsp:Transcript_836/g.2314  ORF Transcript_836/g.2314 Transcript_836/m.2314 type:complete len:94 (-) Transcript_836:402-683(-)
MTILKSGLAGSLVLDRQAKVWHATLQTSIPHTEGRARLVTPDATMPEAGLPEQQLLLQWPLVTLACRLPMMQASATPPLLMWQVAKQLLGMLK